MPSVAHNEMSLALDNIQQDLRDDISFIERSTFPKKSATISKEFGPWFRRSPTPTKK